MSKTYFNYSFQIKRTKTTAIIFLIVIAVAITGFVTWYNSRTKTQKLDSLSYKVVFGMNEFSAKDCDKAYKMNYKKSTCGTICINKMNKNENYLTTVKEEMEKNEFEFLNISNEKLGNKNWKVLQTKNNEPVFTYYAISTKNHTYTMEYVDQTKYLDDTSKNKCNEIFSNLSKSIKIKN